tara:strand:+ start:628 stop:795 length:168 start_codon:yes stop_codon:yes gene_type:complete
LPRKKTPEQEAMLDFHLKELAHFTLDVMIQHSHTVAFILPEKPSNPDSGPSREEK